MKSFLVWSHFWYDEAAMKIFRARIRAWNLLGHINTCTRLSSFTPVLLGSLAVCSVNERISNFLLCHAWNCSFIRRISVYIVIYRHFLWSTYHLGHPADTFLSVQWLHSNSGNDVTGSGSCSPSLHKLECAMCARACACVCVCVLWAMHLIT